MNVLLLRGGEPALSAKTRQKSGQLLMLANRVSTSVTAGRAAILVNMSRASQHGGCFVGTVEGDEAAALAEQRVGFLEVHGEVAQRSAASR